MWMTVGSARGELSGSESAPSRCGAGNEMMDPDGQNQTLRKPIGVRGTGALRVRVMLFRLGQL
jgi:hypothetical protein